MKPYGIVAFVDRPVGHLELGYCAEIFGNSHLDLPLPRYSLSVAGTSLGRQSVNRGLDMDLYVHGGIELFEFAHTVIFPAWDLAQHPASSLVGAILGAHARGCRLVALGSGAFLLGATGLLNGRRATIETHHVGNLQLRHPSILIEPGKVFVEDDRIITGISNYGGVHCLLELVRQDFGARACGRIAARLVGHDVEIAKGPVEERSGSRAQRGEALQHAVEVMQRNPAGFKTLADMAKAAGMTSQNFRKTFPALMGCSPLAWLKDQRLVLAQHILRDGTTDPEEVAARCGFRSRLAMMKALRERQRLDLSNVVRSDDAPGAGEPHLPSQPIRRR